MAAPSVESYGTITAFFGTATGCLSSSLPCAEDGAPCRTRAARKTGSIAVAAAEKLEADGIKARVVSMPSWELFEKQSQEYKDSVLPPSVTARVGVEAGVDQGWYKYLGLSGTFIGMHSFGTSAPQDQCFKHFGITAEAVEAAARKQLK